MLTDNGSAYRSKALPPPAPTPDQIPTHPARPTAINGKAERFIQNLPREWAYDFYCHECNGRLLDKSTHITGNALTPPLTTLLRPPRYMRPTFRNPQLFLMDYLAYIINRFIKLTIAVVILPIKILADFEYYGLPDGNLAKTISLLSDGNKATAPAYKSLIRRADIYINLPPRSVLDKSGIAKSGNKRDFYSLAPYWWPNPNTADGLPYIKRDGYVNPTSREGTDSTAFANTCQGVEQLGLAYHITGNERYAEKAADFIRAWFLNSRTSMNYEVNFAQEVPGLHSGRFEGIIEMRHLTRITDGIALIKRSSHWTKEDHEQFRSWLSKYYKWLLNVDLPIEKTTEFNNHLSWREVQVIQFSLVLDNREFAINRIKKYREELIESQIFDAGDQRLELLRANSLGYSLFNLEALFRLATLGEHLGENWWSYVGSKNQSLYSALDFVAPYCDATKPWIKSEVRPTDRRRIMPLLAQAYRVRKDEVTRKLLGRYYGDGDEIWRLYWPLDENLSDTPGSDHVLDNKAIDPTGEK